VKGRKERKEKANSTLSDLRRAGNGEIGHEEHWFEPGSCPSLRVETKLEATEKQIEPFSSRGEKCQKRACKPCVLSVKSEGQREVSVRIPIKREAKQNVAEKE
jgi:hypothetical protein